VLTSPIDNTLLSLVPDVFYGMMCPKKPLELADFFPVSALASTVEIKGGITRQMRSPVDGSAIIMQPCYIDGEWKSRLSTPITNHRIPKHVPAEVYNIRATAINLALGNPALAGITSAIARHPDAAPLTVTGVLSNMPPITFAMFPACGLTRRVGTTPFTMTHLAASTTWTVCVSTALEETVMITSALPGQAEAMMAFWDRRGIFQSQEVILYEITSQQPALRTSYDSEKPESAVGVEDLPVENVIAVTVPAGVTVPGIAQHVAPSERAPPPVAVAVPAAAAAAAAP
jgi:hypothetical protein